MIQGIMTREWMEKWRIVSPEEYGFHKVIVPDREDRQTTAMYRLNLAAGQHYELMPSSKRVNGVCIKGEAGLGLADRHYHHGRSDSLYTVGGGSVAIGVETDCAFYIGTSVDEGYRTSFFRALNPRLSLGEIHRIHGKGMGQKEAFVMLNQEIQASRLIARLAWGGNGVWTSWPPHQCEVDLEEIYCYFDMNEPHFGLRLSCTAPRDIDNIVAHPVKSGSMVLAPRGYHPTMVSPGTQNAYFRVLAAHSHESHSYDLAVLDPRREQVS